MKMIKIILCMIISFNIYADISFASTDKQNTLLELFTSEGCSSCPPADKWLSQLKNDSRLFKDIVPISFHVDYWDSLGWNDKFASKRYSTRQRQYKYLNRISSVYTPGVVKNGEEFRVWYYNSKSANSNKQVGKLSANIKDNKLVVDFTNLTIAKNTILNIAILGVDIVSNVEGGENVDVVLNHDFVVLTHRQYGGNNATVNQHWNVPMPKPKISAPRYAIALWISQTDDLNPIQTTGSWLSSNLIQ